MKKLMIAVAVVAASIAANAASFSWATSGKAMSIGAATITAGLADGTVYNVSGTANADTMSNQMTSFGAVWAYTMTITAGTDSDVLSGTFASGDFSSRKISIGLESALFDAASLTNPVDFNYSIVLTGTLKDGNDATVTLTSNTITGNATFGGGDLKMYTDGASSWTASVPEPTSGLLMLLGMAGLALRRRRA